MRLANAVFYDADDMFWDRRARDLEDQALQPVMDAVEMGFSPEAGGIPALIQRLEGTSYYPALFQCRCNTVEDLIKQTRTRLLENPNSCGRCGGI